MVDSDLENNIMCKAGPSLVSLTKQELRMFKRERERERERERDRQTDRERERERERERWLCRDNYIKPYGRNGWLHSFLIKT